MESNQRNNLRGLLIGVYADSETIGEINKVSNKFSLVSAASVKYTRLIHDGLSKNMGGELSALALCPVGMFPSSKILFWKRKSSINIRYIPFFNILLFKQVSILIYVNIYCLMWLVGTKWSERKVIFISSLYAPFLLGIIPLKFFKKVRIVTFVPDLPEYEFTYSENIGFIKRLFIPFYIVLSKYLVELSDYNVFVTEHMKDKFPVRPFMIVDGLIDAVIDNSVPSDFSVRNAVMYSGALFKKYGVENLVRAFTEIPGDWELWLFGYGDFVPFLADYQKNDPRLKYFGNIDNEIVLFYQRQAKLLVNPRFTNEEFTKFSFPSKLLEYMSSGTPVLTTRLAGISTQYDPFLFYIQDESILGMKNALIQCLTTSQEELLSVGSKAREYVLRNKESGKLMGDLVLDVTHNCF